MTVRPSWETARNRPGSSSRRRTRRAAAVALLDELLDAAAPDRDEGDLGGDEEALEERQDDDDQDLLDRDVHASGSGSRLRGGGRAARGSGPGRRRPACRPARPCVTTAPAPVFAPVADLDRGDEHRVDAEEGPLADRRPVLRPAVPVGGDRAGAHVRPLAELGVAEVAHVVLLDAGAEAGVLELGEVADLGARADVACPAGGG